MPLSIKCYWKKTTQTPENHGPQLAVTAEENVVGFCSKSAAHFSGCTELSVFGVHISMLWVLSWRIRKKPFQEGLHAFLSHCTEELIRVGEGRQEWDKDCISHLICKKTVVSNHDYCNHCTLDDPSVRAEHFIRLHKLEQEKKDRMRSSNLSLGDSPLWNGF